MNHNYWIIEQKKSTTPTNSHKKMGVYTATKFYDFLSHKLAQNMGFSLATNSHKFSQINHRVGLQQNTDLTHLNPINTQIKKSV